MSQSAPRFSVLLPTHNRADVLPFAIASVLAQTERDFELLIVADGCTDTTAAVVASFNDDRIRFFDLPKAAGFGYANRNIALRQSHGRLIAYAAHDDIMLPDHLAIMGTLLDAGPAKWAYSRPLWVTSDGYVLPICLNLELPDEAAQFRQSLCCPPSMAVVHTRAALEEAGFWPEDALSSGDLLLWQRIIGDEMQNLAFTRTPTTLHFIANWRKSRYGQAEDVRRLLEGAELAPWWPPALRYMPVNGTHQQALWQAMQAGDGEWLTQLRAKIDVVIDRMAWTPIRLGLQPTWHHELFAYEWKIRFVLSRLLRCPPLRALRNRLGNLH